MQIKHNAQKLIDIVMGEAVLLLFNWNESISVASLTGHLQARVVGE